MLVFLIILLCAIVYTLPGLIALGRKLPAWKRIWLINVFLGFTIIGWVWALRDALKRDAGSHRKVFYSYSYTYGEKGQKTRFDLRQLPITSEVGLAVGALAVVALFGALGWKHGAPTSTPAVVAAATVAAPQGWTYTQEEDHAGVVHISTLMSDDTDQAGDRIPAALIVRSGPAGLSVGVKIDGQFTCSAAADGAVAVKFDGGDVQSQRCARRPDDDPRLTAGGQDMLFLADPEAFVARAMASHTMVVSADLLGTGVRSARFSPQGLNLAMAGLPQTAEADVASDVTRPEEADAQKPFRQKPEAKAHRTAHSDRHPRYKSWHE